MPLVASAPAPESPSVIDARSIEARGRAGAANAAAVNELDLGAKRGASFARGRNGPSGQPSKTTGFLRASD